MANTKNPKKNGESVRIPEPAYSTLKKQAKANYRTISAQIVYLVDKEG